MQLAAHIAVDAHQAVTVVAMRVLDAQGGVDRNLMVVDAEAVALGVAVGEKPGLQHAVGGVADTGHIVGRVKG